MRIDERNVMFARMARKEGTETYDAYYAAHPEYKVIDDQIKTLPHMGSLGTAMYDPLNSPMIDAAFHFLSDIKHLVDGPVANVEKTMADPDTMTSRILGLAKHYGAVLCDIAPQDASYYYSHRGRMDENFGEVVEVEHPYTIVFAVEMEKELIDTAPKIPQSLAVTKGYIDAAIIGMILTYYIKSLGYEARNHMDGNYLLVLPLAAKSAGFGDIGRHGLLITEDYGSRVRLGAVTTNMPLIPALPSTLSVKEFCTICGKCAKTCPAKAISKEEPNLIDGVMRWQISQEACYTKWRSLGTDCGICVSTCPFSSNLPHELIDAYKQDSTLARQLLTHHEQTYPLRPFIKHEPIWLK